MKDYMVKDIRNIAVLGHGSEGKTTLVEAMLYAAGVIDRQGRVEDGNTVSDWDPEEIKRHISISASVAPIEIHSKKLNMIDVPGYFDFAGEMPGTPASSTPRPPLWLIRWCAPSCTARRPATWLIGVSSGRPPWASVTVS